jgi:hypothetical protein
VTEVVDRPLVPGLLAMRALSDFSWIAGALERGAAQLRQEDLGEFSTHGLDSFDRLAFQVP